MMIIVMIKREKNEKKKEEGGKMGGEIRGKEGEEITPERSRAQLKTYWFNSPQRVPVPSKEEEKSRLKWAGENRERGGKGGIL